MRAALAMLSAAILLAGCSESTTTTGTGPLQVTATTVPAPHFDPANVTVPVGGTLTFHVAAGHHTVTFNETGGLSNADSGDLGPQLPYAVQFRLPGVFHYHCRYHAGMVGQVTVA